MQKEKAYRSNNTVKHVAPVAPISSSWPPPWLVKARETATANPLPPPDEPPELAEWDNLTVEECGEPCPKCGSLEKWWDFYDNQHCQQCEPIRRAMALADLAARLRRKKP